MKYMSSYLFAAFSLLTGYTAHAQTAVQIDTLRGAQQDGTVSGSTSGDFYGDHVANDSNWLIVGAPREDVDLNNSGNTSGPGEADAGAIYIYKRTAGGLVFHQKIEGEGNQVNSGDRFGAGVTLSGEWLFVGAANDNDFPGVDPIPHPSGPFFFAGKVYVYLYDAGTDSWNLTQKLTSDVPNSLGSFGARTDSSHVELFSFGNTEDSRIALIGEIQNGSGLAAKLHVFQEKAGVWSRVQIATSPSGNVNTSFADSVTSIGKLALVPESGFDPVSDPAVVHVYRISPNGIVKFDNMLQPIQSLASPSGNTDINVCGNLGFGAGLGAGGDTVAIADPCDSSDAPASGVVHVYRLDDNGNNAPLSLLQTLSNPMPQGAAYFGASSPHNGKQTISASSDVIAVGSPQNLGVIFPPQDVYLFGRQNDGTFLLTDNIPTPEPAVTFLGSESYGQSVTLSGDGELYIGQMGLFFEGGGRLFIFELQ